MSDATVPKLAYEVYSPVDNNTSFQRTQDVYLISKTWRTYVRWCTLFIFPLFQLNPSPRYKVNISKHQQNLVFQPYQLGEVTIWHQMLTTKSLSIFISSTTHKTSIPILSSFSEFHFVDTVNKVNNDVAGSSKTITRL